MAPFICCCCSPSLKMIMKHLTHKHWHVIASHGEEQWLVEQIIDERWQSQGNQYLVHWVGLGQEEDHWLPSHGLADIVAQNDWLGMLME